MLTVTASFLSDLFISSAAQGLFQVFFRPPEFALMAKSDLTFPALCLRFVDIAPQFCFRYKLSIPRKAAHDSV